MDNGLNSSFTYTQSYRLFLSVFVEKRYILCKLLTISKFLSRHDKNMAIQKKKPHWKCKFWSQTSCSTIDGFFCGYNITTIQHQLYVF